MTSTIRSERAELLRGSRQFLTDGGLETTLMFHEGWELPIGEAFTLIETAKGRAALVDYYERYIALAKPRNVGFLLESPTWRANPDWAQRIGYDSASLARANIASVELMHMLRDRHETSSMPMPISGCIGPRGDGYRPEHAWSAAEAENYHSWQLGVLAGAGVDLVSAITMTSTNEGIGIAKAAKAAGVACVISFTLETNGHLPSGEPLDDAIAAVDFETGSWPIYYMINCAHPTHFDHLFGRRQAWAARLGGMRANASRRSHQELDDSPELDIGNPDELGGQYGELLAQLPNLKVLGGCCGTDHRHVEAIAKACVPT